SGGGVVDLTGDEDPIDEDGDTEVGDSEVSVSLGEISFGGRKSQESNIGDSDNTEDGGKIVGGAIRACSRGIVCAVTVIRESGVSAACVVQYIINAACGDRYRTVKEFWF
nr:hypothetical protein [Tanacetum cinerariifolium]